MNIRHIIIAVTAIVLWSVFVGIVVLFGGNSPQFLGTEMKQLLLVVLLAFVGIANAEMPVDIKAQIKAAAFDKWDDDYTMIKYQITQETEAYDKLQMLSPGTVPADVWSILQQLANRALIALLGVPPILNLTG